MPSCVLERRNVRNFLSLYDASAKVFEYDSLSNFFSLGYGHIAPKTAVAKIVTIFYAILGIPLTVLCWSNIGDAMANAFRFSYWRIFCYLCTKKPKKRRQRRMHRPGRS